MSETAEKQGRPFPIGINRIIYVLFILIGLFRCFREGASEGLVYFGIALAFDPFNHDQKWADRPLYQKAWLLLHVGVVLVLFGLMIYHTST